METLGVGIGMSFWILVIFKSTVRVAFKASIKILPTEIGFYDLLHALKEALHQRGKLICPARVWVR